MVVAVVLAFYPGSMVVVQPFVLTLEVPLGGETQATLNATIGGTIYLTWKALNNTTLTFEVVSPPSDLVFLLPTVTHGGFVFTATNTTYDLIVKQAPFGPATGVVVWGNVSRPWL
jgi:hypothetical protein